MGLKDGIPGEEAAIEAWGTGASSRKQGLPGGWRQQGNSLKEPKSNLGKACANLQGASTTKRCKPKGERERAGICLYLVHNICTYLWGMVQ